MNNNGAAVLAGMLLVVIGLLVVIAVDVRNFSRFVDESRVRDAEFRARVERQIK